jgi:aerobic-type carbon monoxide dehydrogenase small subunit (CoxS/CutS family)
VTIEGLDGNHPLQKFFMNEVGAQCGICTPGMIMAALALPDDPTLDDVKVALAGNLCRCTGYSAIYRAVMKWKSGQVPA